MSGNSSSPSNPSKKWKLVCVTRDNGIPNYYNVMPQDSDDTHPYSSERYGWVQEQHGTWAARNTMPGTARFSEKHPTREAALEAVGFTHQPATEPYVW